MRDHFNRNMALHLCTFIPLMKDHLWYKTTSCGLWMCGLKSQVSWYWNGFLLFSEITNSQNVCEVFRILDFAYSVWSFLHFGIWMFTLHTEFYVDLGRNDAKMMLKHDLEYLSLDPGLPWMFEKSGQPHILRDRHSIVTILGNSVFANTGSRLTGPCSQYLICHLPYTICKTFFTCTFERKIT